MISPRIARIDLSKTERLYDEDGTFLGHSMPLDALLPTDRPPKPAKYSDQWLAVFTPALLKLARRDALDFASVRVLLAVLGRVRSTTEEWEVPLTQISVDTGVHRGRISACITRLEAAGFLTRTRKGFIKIRPETAWRGNAADREAELKKEEK